MICTRLVKSDKLHENVFEKLVLLEDKDDTDIIVMHALCTTMKEEWVKQKKPIQPWSNCLNKLVSKSEQ